MSDAEDKTKTGDRETKEAKEDGHVDNEISDKIEDGKDDGKSKDKVTPSKKNAKPKNQKDEEKVDEEEDSEEEEDDDDDDEDGENEKNGKVPLLDQPLQISGTRDRKKVQRFSEEFKAVVRESPKNEIPEGRGVPLGEIPRIESLIMRQSAEKLKPLYKVLFNRPGKLTMIKRNIRKFNGFDFKEGSDEYSKKRANLVKLDKKSLKTICSTLLLHTSGSREEQANNIIEFLMEPKDTKKTPLQKESKKKKKEAGRNSSSKKTNRKSSSSAKSKKKVDTDDEDESSEDEMEVDDKESSGDEKKKPSNEKDKASGTKKESPADKKDSSDEKESSDEKNESSDEEEEDSDDDKKKKKAPKKKLAANAKKPTPKKVEKKVEAPKKTEAKSADKKKRKEKESEAKSDDESSEDEPLVKKTKMPPTDEEIKSFVKQILEGANLEEITMKTVCKQVYAAYPEFDLAHKKDFIKTTVKSLIST